MYSLTAAAACVTRPTRTWSALSCTPTSWPPQRSVGMVRTGRDLDGLVYGAVGEGFLIQYTCELHLKKGFVKLI